MESLRISSLLEQLDDEIDDLEDALAIVLQPMFSKTSSTLPLLDKAKLYVLVTYAIESILFSYLRLNGVKAREHPVFQELSRVKQYFGKIKAAEEPSDERPLVNLDTQAAARFIIAGLAGNEKYDSKRAQQLDFDTNEKSFKTGCLSKTTENATNSPSSTSDSPSLSHVGMGIAGTRPSMVVKESKKRNFGVIDDPVVAPSLSHAGSDSEYNGERKNGKEKKRRKKNKGKGTDDGKEVVRS